MFANFYHNDTCLFSIKVNSESEAYRISDNEFARNKDINDWTITENPIGVLVH